MGMKLFDGSDEDASSDQDISKIEINTDFARRYEHNKKREDLHRLQDLKKKGLVHDSDDDDSSSEDEDELIDSKKNLDFFNALIKVKNKDPVLKTKEAKLFDSENEEEEDEEENEVKREKKKEKKPMYLKDVTARHLIEQGPDFEEDEKEYKFRVKSYSEEQEELRKEFLDAADKALEGDDDDDGGELLKEKESKNVEDDDDDDEVEKKLDEYFGKDDNLDQNEIFLKEYFRNRMWVGGEGEENEEQGLDISEDEEEIEKQEDYERGYNFRFEENVGDRVLGHSRIVEGSVRKKTNARKAQRKSKEERMAQAEFERKEELKHLKNLKKKEMKEKLRKIKDTAGTGENWVCPLDEDDLEEEFDPEEYDRKMKEAFNDDYYDADDADPEFGSDEDELEKPDFDKEDELLGLEKGWDDVGSSRDGFLAVRERNLKRRTENEGEEEVLQEGEGKRKKKQKMSELEEVLNEDLEEYYKLDYEDTIGDLKTRFKYREVGAKRFGLRTEEILMLDDSELNQYVSLKKLAPYREKEWKVPRNKRYNQIQRTKELLNDNKSAKKKLKIEDKKSAAMDVSMDGGKAKMEESNGDTNNLSRRRRRKQRQADLKLSQSRLMAYGKIPSKSRSKKKH